MKNQHRASPRGVRASRTVLIDFDAEVDAVRIGVSAARAEQDRRDVRFRREMPELIQSLAADLSYQARDLDPECVAHGVRAALQELVDQNRIVCVPPTIETILDYMRREFSASEVTVEIETPTTP